VTAPPARPGADAPDGGGTDPDGIRRAVVATAPVRVADVGGWTDTWFGAPGQVCSLAVEPGVQVRAELVDAPAADAAAELVDAPAADAAARVHLVAPDLGEDYRFDPPSEPTPPAGARATAGGGPARSLRQPLLEHAAAEALERHPVPDGSVVRLTVTSAVPVGASLGTSASVVVAVLGALDALLAPSPEPADLDPADLARRAHTVETARAGREAGVQDHWAAAVGHAQHLVVDTYPTVRSRRLDLTDRVREELADRVVTVAFGPHDSSAVHGEVIQALLSCDGTSHDRVRHATRRLASLAAEAADRLEAGDVDGWAAVLTRATEAQAHLHPGLVGAPHQAAIDVARSLGAVGWKVNGAGGGGGSLTVVASRTGASSAALRRRLAAGGPGWQVLDLGPAGGLQVRAVDAGPEAEVAGHPIAPGPVNGEPQPPSPR
jgi:D-glycero-alpha-D-manno-heptose-7-phosphate kinase